MSLFTDILNGTIPGYFVWKDELCFSIMTIAPIRQGHLLVIPNEEVNHWDDVPEATAAHLFVVAQKIAKAQKLIITCKRIGVSIVGLEVPHTHIHLIPIDTMADLDFSYAQEMAAELLKEMASKIKTQLIAQGHQQADV